MSMPDTAHKTINAETAETAEPTGFSARSASSALNVRELTFGEAVKEAIAEEMRRDDRVVVFGEDVAEAGTAFKVLAGLVPGIGPQHIIDTPISETGVPGLRRGGPMTGMRPNARIMFGDLLRPVSDE